MVNDNPLFTETEHFNDVAMQIDMEATQALRPIIKKFLAVNYNIREICHVLIHAAAGLEHEYILDAQYRAHKEKQACLQENKKSGQ